jgi:glutathione S-transferase
MKLIGSYTSPYVRKVRVVLAEKKFEYEFVIDSPWLEDSTVPDLNPLGKIPVLLLDDETQLFDSRVIVEYIDAVTPNNKLFPAPNRERIEVKRWEALADGICDAAATAFLEAKRPKKRAKRCLDCPPTRKNCARAGVHGRSSWRKALLHRHPLLDGRYCRRLGTGLSGLPFWRYQLAGKPPQPGQALRQTDAATVFRGQRTARLENQGRHWRPFHFLLTCCPISAPAGHRDRNRGDSRHSAPDFSCSSPDGIPRPGKTPWPSGLPYKPA